MEIIENKSENVKIVLPDPPKKRGRGRPPKAKCSLQNSDSNESNKDEPLFTIPNEKKTNKQIEMEGMKKELKNYFIKNPKLQQESSSSVNIDLKMIDEMDYEELQTRLLLCQASFSKKFDSKVSKQLSGSLGACCDSLCATDEIQNAMVSDEMLNEALHDLGAPIFSMMNPMWRVATLTSFHILIALAHKFKDGVEGVEDTKEEIKVVEIE